MYITDDNALIASCLVGEESAWEELVERYSQLVYSIPCHFGFSTADTEAIFQATFSSLLTSLPKIRNQNSISQWLIATAYRECQSFHAEVGGGNDLLNKSLPPELAKRWQGQQSLRIAMQQIDRSCQVLVTSLLSNQINDEQIAEQLGITQSEIKTKQVYCFRKLEEILSMMRVKWE